MTFDKLIPTARLMQRWRRHDVATCATHVNAGRQITGGIAIGFAFRHLIPFMDATAAGPTANGGICGLELGACISVLV
jgi:hypothetical protein